MANAIVPLKPTADALPWAGQELAIIKQVIAPGLSDLELAVFGKFCQQTRLNPILKQIYAIKRSGKMTIQTSIDGYRLIASRTGQLAGIDKAVYYHDEAGKLVEAEVTVYRMVHGQRCAFTASAFWDEYKPAAGQDHMWVKMPRRMLAKCAESLALRMAFPAELSGIYTDAEMEQAGTPEALVVEAQTTGAQVLAQATIREEQQAEPEPPDVVDLKARATALGVVGDAWKVIVCEATGKTEQEARKGLTVADRWAVKKRLDLIQANGKPLAKLAEAAKVVDEPEQEPAA